MTSKLHPVRRRTSMVYSSSSVSTAPRTRSLRSRIRAGVVLGVILSFLAVTPLSVLYTLYSSVFGRPSSLPGRLFLAWTAAEAAFGAWYLAQAYRVNAHRPELGKDKRRIRDVVKTVLESNLGESAAELKSRASSRRSSIAESFASSRRNSLSLPSSNISSPRQRTRTRGMSMNSDSGYGSDSSSDGKLSASATPPPPALSPLLELDDPISASAAPETTYNFLEPRLAPDDPRAVDFREAARKWFHGADFASLFRRDVSQWMAWSLYGQPYEEIVRERGASISQGVKLEHLPKEDDLGRDKLETVDYSVDLWEARTGTTLKDGEGPEADVIRLTLDPVRVLCRPLALYVAVWCAQRWYDSKLSAWGFKRQHHGGLEYLVRTPASWTPEAEGEEFRPLLFLHGLGVGPVQYAPILDKLATNAAFSHRPIVILTQPHLSMSIVSSRYLSPPNAEESSASLRAMAKANAFDRQGLTVLSHSNGTIVHGWLLKAVPELVARSCLIDPVCFALWEPSLPYNFLYAAARSPMQQLMRFFVARELGVANLLQRHFDWISSLLVPSTDIPNLDDSSKAAVFLSERDAIVDTPRIRAYLEGEGMNEASGLKVWKGKKHGEALLKQGKAFQEVMSWLRDD